ncbi:MAG: molybdopterin molybdotransferase MoeA [Alphaproteobacteria bacterium]|nr:molybdopterin molybdotransferase MoeA [Alphaproteobacteria bacterium]
MISFDDAFQRVVEIAVPLGTQCVPLGEGAGRILAEPVIARLSMPRCDVSAMDGYAVRSADLGAVPFSLPVRGETAAGSPPGAEFAPGTAVRIFTGAPVPVGADRVIVQENVEREGELARIVRPPGAARHIREAGSDFREGDILVPAGRQLDWRTLTVAAAAAQSPLKVYLRPRGAILATGDELAVPGEASGIPGAIPESISPAIAAFVRSAGGQLISREMYPDDPAQLRLAAAAALAGADLLILIGGASVGDRDHSRSLFAGPPDYIFPKVAIKPGKPVWLARIGGKLVLGLPGNPTSALVTARLFLAPLLAGLGGRDAAATVVFESWALAAALPAAGDRETFVRARIRDNRAMPLIHQDSSGQASLLEADLLLRQPPGNSDFQPGETIQGLLF